MALPVRPGIQPAPPVAPRAEAGRLAAQKAFFQAALARPEQAQAPLAAPPARAAQAPAATAAAPAPAPTSQAPTRAATDEPPTRILRPGSLLDIRV